MTRYLYIATLVLFASCTQRKDNADQNKSTEHLTQDTIKKVNNTMDLSSEANVRSIDTLSEKLKYFIPSDYSAIDASFGDANLDGISDAILVLGKTDESLSHRHSAL